MIALLYLFLNLGLRCGRRISIRFIRRRLSEWSFRNEPLRRRNPRARIVEMKGCGHAPPLMSAEQIGCVSEFLNA